MNRRIANDEPVKIVIGYSKSVAEPALT
jgi:hypothetical protein